MIKTRVHLAANEELAPTPGPNDALPPIPIWQTYSFWLLAGAVLIPVLKLFGVEPPFGNEEFANIMMTLVPAVLALLAYGQRAAPNFRIVFWK